MLSQSHERSEKYAGMFSSRRPEGGLVAESFIQCENVRAASRKRFKRLRGRVSEDTMHQVADRLRILLGL